MAAREVLVVDGYNVLGAWPQLTRGRGLADQRDELIHRLSDYAAFTGQTVILVFDAWKQPESAVEDTMHSPQLQIIYTSYGETADSYIERISAELADDIADERVKLRVASSDGTEQAVVLAHGALRISSRELIRELKQARESEARMIKQSPVKRNTLLSRLPDELQQRLEQMRRGKG